MNYDRITYFVKAAETLNFSEAARQMYITPQAFGRQISQLEEEFGTELFTRTKHKVSLTLEGEYLYKHMAPLVEAFENGYRAMLSTMHNRSGKLNVGILSFLSRSKCISPIITQIYSKESSMEINTQMYEMRELTSALDSGEIDLGFTMMHQGLPLNENYEMVSLLQSQTYLMVSLYHEWVVKDRITFEDMKQIDRIRFNIGHDSADNPYITYPCKNDIIVENYATMLSELERGEGYILVSPELSENSITYKTKCFPLPGDPFYISLTMLYKKSEKRPEVLELIEAMREVFEP